MSRLLSVDQGLDLFNMFFGFTASDGDIFAWTAEIVPPAIKRQRANNYIGKLAGMFSHLHLRAVEAAQDGIEDVAGCEVVEVAIREAFEAVCLFAASRVALALQFEPGAEVGRGGNRVDSDNALNAHILEHIHGQRVCDATVDVEFAINLHRHTGARNSAAGVDGLGDLSRGKDHPIQRSKMCRHNAKRAHHFGEMGVADGSFEALFDLFTPQKSLARQNERINQLEQSPAMLQFARESFHADAVVAGSPHRPNVRTHATTGNNVHFDAVLLQHLYDTNMSQPAGTAGREG